MVTAFCPGCHIEGRHLDAAEALLSRTPARPLTLMHALVAPTRLCAAKYRHFRTPARTVCTLSPLARSARVCYTLTMGRKARPLWSAAVTSGTGRAALLAPENGLVSRLFAPRRVDMRPTRRRRSWASQGSPGHEKRTPIASTPLAQVCLIICGPIAGRPG